MAGSDLTIDVTDIPGGYAYRRSDGEEFYLMYRPDDGHAVLYRGKYGDAKPSLGIVDFDISIVDKREAARQRVLFYPEAPPGLMR